MKIKLNVSEWPAGWKLLYVPYSDKANVTFFSIVMFCVLGSLLIDQDHRLPIHIAMLLGLALQYYHVILWKKNQYK